MIWTKSRYAFGWILLMAVGLGGLVGSIAWPCSEVDLSRNAETTSLRQNSVESSNQESLHQKHKPKSGLEFVLGKTKLLLKLCLYIVVGVFLANLLEVTGIIKYFAFLAWPVIRLGKLERTTSSAFLVAFQSGAIANSMLVANRDAGLIDNRQLYSSILVVSCLSLFAHLPVYVLPIGAVLGPQATVALFLTRFVAIVVEIIAILLVGSLLVRRSQRRLDQSMGLEPEASSERDTKDRLSRKRTTDNRSKINRIWQRSRKTMLRLLIYVVPTFLVMGALEYAGVFALLSKVAPGLFTLDFLPVQSTVIIPAQALSLYNGAIAAAGFVDSGDIQVKQAVLIILMGSIITAPIRTLKHALPTYISILGVKMGTTLSITAQVLRSLFLVAATIGLWLLW